MDQDLKSLKVVCIDDKGWPSTIPESHHLVAGNTYTVVRITKNHNDQTKLILDGFEDLDLVTGGRFDGYSKARLIPMSIVEDLWTKEMLPQINESLNK